MRNHVGQSGLHKNDLQSLGSNSMVLLNEVRILVTASDSASLNPTNWKMAVFAPCLQLSANFA